MAKKGDQKTCPRCGASVRSMNLYCSECGHEFSNTESSVSVNRFFKKYANAFFADDQYKLISTFPIPNNREDIIEFFTMASSMPVKSLWSMPAVFGTILVLAIISLTLWVLALGNFNEDGLVIIISLAFLGGLGTIIGCAISLSDDKSKRKRADKNLLADAWQVKIEQALTKVKLMSFSQKEQNIIKNVVTHRQRIKIYPILLIVILIILCVVPAFMLNRKTADMNAEYNNWSHEVNKEIELYADSLNAQLDALPMPTVKNYEECIDKFSAICWNKTWIIPEKFHSVTEEKELGNSQHESFAKRKGSYALRIGAAWSQHLEARGIDTSVIPHEYQSEIFQKY